MTSTTASWKWKPALTEAAATFVLLAIITRLLMPGAPPLNMRLGGKWADMTHAILIAFLGTLIFSAGLAAYFPLANLKAMKFARGGPRSYRQMYTHGYTESQCASCASGAPPKPEPAQTYFGGDASAGDADDCYVGAHRDGAKVCRNGDCQ